ncbi:MAG: hypothetical protein WC933_03710 [Candidatus Paceibacterota bacterium]|jgi:hypothetical protein
MKNPLTDFICEDCEELIKTNEQANNLKKNPRDFAGLKIDGKE